MGDPKDAANDFFSKFDNEEENLVDFSDSSPEPKSTDKEDPKDKANPDDPKPVDKKADADIDPDDEKIPFHKHPRWQEKLDENNKLKKDSANWAKEKQALEDRLEKLEKPPKTEEELEAMTPKEQQEYFKEQAEKEFNQKNELSEKDKAAAEKYIDDAFTTIKDTGFELTKDIENEILVYSEKYTEGNIEKAFELFQKFNDTKESGKEEEAKESAKKKAANSNKSNKGAPSKTGGFVRGTEWGNLDLK